MAGVTSQTQLSGGVAVAAYSAFSGINVVTDANYTGTDTDGYSSVHFSTGASDRTYTPPTASATNAGRRIRLLKIDSGVGGIAIAGTIGGSSSNNTIKARYGRAEIESDGSAWYWVQDITEKGSWSPALTAATPGTEANASNNGWYVRVGRLVTFGGATEYTKGTASGTLNIPLPFTSDSASSAWRAATSTQMDDRTLAIANTRQMYTQIASSSVLLQFRWAGGTTTAQGAQVVAADLGSSAVDVYIGGAYTVA